MAEIISCKDESSSEDPNSMMHGTGGLVLKVKGRERFRILNVRKEITGCVIATVIRDHMFCFKHILIIDLYLKGKNSSRFCIEKKSTSHKLSKEYKLFL